MSTEDQGGIRLRTCCASDIRPDLPELVPVAVEPKVPDEAENKLRQGPGGDFAPVLVSLDDKRRRVFVGPYLGHVGEENRGVPGEVLATFSGSLG
jgi:hypothetical protein